MALISLQETFLLQPGMALISLQEISLLHLEWLQCPNLISLCLPKIVVVPLKISKTPAGDIAGKKKKKSFEQIYRTMGLISADRSNKATLLLTTPRSIKVVCNGFISSNIIYSYSTKNRKRR
ncbi:hypothetical protein K457DRAFT_756739 [Linnemannia elongata AG-77]|uniref:Uncharacterized protein n=1 Tax=Linnemannia elongata AG-77 TaxID=1314771 RepID=A0A197JKF6_9FUNG|nr:hypothetical protein K457DRAFT_756739 [Linnemannia elongata AG-77]